MVSDQQVAPGEQSSCWRDRPPMAERPAEASDAPPRTQVITLYGVAHAHVLPHHDPGLALLPRAVR